MYHKTEQEIMQNWQGNIAEPVVSVCCTTYNHGPYIAEALDGFLMQETTFPFEILVRDDCSTDNTAGIIQEYAEKYPSLIKPVYEKENTFSKGVRPMWELINKFALGDYLALCEGDDYWIDSLKLQKQVNFLDKNPDYGLVCTDMIQYIEKDKKFIESNIIPLGQLHQSEMTSKDYVYEELIYWRSQIWTLTVCLRKSLLDDLPVLEPSMFFTGDRLFFIHISLKSKVKFLHEKTAVYRVLDESASHIKDPLQSLDFLFKIANLMLYFLDRHPVNTQLHQNELYKNMLIKFQFTLASGEYGIFNTIELKLPPNPTIKMMGFKVLYYFCKSKLFFRILSFVYQKRIYAPIKSGNS